MQRQLVVETPETKQAEGEVEQGVLAGHRGIKQNSVSKSSEQDLTQA